ncbi:hypothetical protein P154DRAFT_590346 [Amniculicola lignicola CBS 123094]|uniref:Zn(2)-C6 fungal-type domain-containing protein n=1 Tax=Amniculicola lignicola CBS 123094 TaxID=1392246 RepID=A0A6A5VTY1_9PLEO|nr:hypothetical protein P154DRAFT_590346 [Amniculicola lignicola CBS 123094]
MFATLSYKDIDDEIKLTPASATCFNGGKAMRLACIECRAKKIKCTGEKFGCSKCSANSIPCVYPSNSDRNRRKRKQSVVERSSRAANVLNDIRSSNSTGGDDVRVTSPRKSPGDPDPIPPQAKPHNVLDFEVPEVAFLPDLLSEFPTKDDETSKGMTQLSFLDFTTVDHGSRPDPSLNRHSRAAGSPRAAATEAQIKDPSLACACPQMAMYMLDELESKHHSDDELSVSNVLTHQKEALAKVQKWLDCSNCSTPTAVRTLLALIIQRLTVYLEKGVARYFGELSQGDSGLDDKYKGNKVQGKFQVDSRYEWAQVMRVLLKIRAKDLEQVLSRLKESALMDRRESQLPVLASTERRTRTIIAELTESGSAER